MKIDTGTRTEADAARFQHAHADESGWPDRPDPSDLVNVECDECQDTGWVNHGCSRDPDCPGGDCCDQRCGSCEAGRL